MKYLLTPRCYNRELFAWWDNAFSSDELDWLQNQSKLSQQTAAIGLGKGEIDKSYRSSKVSWMECSNESKWVYDKLSDIISEINARFFYFDLDGFGEPIQLTNYDSFDSGKYNWHIDVGSNHTSVSRKLSLVMQLSHPNEYEGGELELMPFSKEKITIEKKRGLITFFPSWTLHQVSELTKGSRQSLVAWISGPPFR